MPLKPKRKNEIILVDGDDITRVTALPSWQYTKMFRLTGDSIPLDTRILLPMAEARAIILAWMRGKRLKAVRANKHFYIGRLPKEGRGDHVTLTSDAQLAEAVASVIVEPGIDLTPVASCDSLPRTIRKGKAKT